MPAMTTDQEMKNRAWEYSESVGYELAVDRSTGKPLPIDEALARLDPARLYGAGPSAGRALHNAVLRAAGVPPEVHGARAAVARWLGIPKQAYSTLLDPSGLARSIEIARNCELCIAQLSDGTWLVWHPSAGGWMPKVSSGHELRGH